MTATLLAIARRIDFGTVARRLFLPEEFLDPGARRLNLGTLDPDSTLDIESFSAAMKSARSIFGSPAAPALITRTILRDQTGRPPMMAI